jgi:cbb3-type cytochrome c oxidase subunit III
VCVSVRNVSFGLIVPRGWREDPNRPPISPCSRSSVERSRRPACHSCRVDRRSLVIVLASATLLLTACGSTKTVTVTVGAQTVPTTKVSDLVAEGAHDFNQFACAQCHGPNGRGGVSPAVPALKVVGKAFTAAQLRTIIDHGLGESANPTRPYMPVWGQVISSRQVTALVAYVHAGLPAVAGATPAAVQTDQGPVVEGSQLYVRDGCINCHGPNGLGGVPNPSSPDKSIPPLSGADFFSQFNTDKKIIDVIRSGSVIGRAPIVSMPHWGGILSDGQLHALVAYIKTLKTG